MARRRVENASLRRLLSVADWTYEALARAVNALGAENGVGLHYDRTAVAHWVTGSLPRPETRDLLAEVFARRLGRPVSVAELGMGPSPSGVLSALESHDSAVGALAALCGMDADPARRQLLEHCHVRAGALEVPAWQDRERAGAANPWPCPGDRARDVSAVRDAVVFFRGVSELGGRHGRTALVAYLLDDVVPRLHADTGEPPHQALLSQTARLVHVLARCYVDDVRHGAAQLYFRAALDLVTEAGDRTAYAVVLRGMSTLALELGHRAAALRAASAATRSASEGASDDVRAYLLVQLALGQAVSGFRDKAAETLRTAEDHHRRADLPEAVDEQDTARWYSRASVDFRRGRVLAALGDRTGAVAALRRSLERRPATACLPCVLTHAEIARLLLRDGFLEDCCAEWHRFLDGYLHLRSGRAERALAELRGDLRAHRAYRAVRLLLSRAQGMTSGQR